MNNKNFGERIKRLAMRDRFIIADFHSETKSANFVEALTLYVLLTVILNLKF